MVLMDFTGSDWCGWCIKMDKEIFSTPEFQKYAQANLVLVELDFPHKKQLPPATKQQNDALAKTVRGGRLPDDGRARFERQRRSSSSTVTWKVARQPSLPRWKS